MDGVQSKFKLSNDRFAKLKAQLRSEGFAAKSLPPIERHLSAEPAPLSYAQQRLWLVHQIEPESPAYNFPAGVSFQGELNISVLERALNEIVRRHASLRTRFDDSSGSAVQIVTEFVTLPLPLIDLRACAASEIESTIQKVIHGDVYYPFDLRQGPPIRVKLVRKSLTDHLLIITLHHIVSDGWAFSILLNELAHLYSAFSLQKPSPFAELAIQYTDFARWQRRWIDDAHLQSDLAYWKKKLVGVPPALELPTDRPHTPTMTYRGKRHFFSIPKPLTAALTQLSQKNGATLFMTLLAAYKILLLRYTDRRDMVVGTPVASRNRSEIEGMIGFFLNMQVLRTDLSGNPSFSEVLQRVRATSLEAFSHQELPFERLVEEIQPERIPGFTPLYQAMFVLQSRSQPPWKFPNLNMTAVNLDRGAAVCDLTLQLAETDGALKGFIEYSTDVFDESTIARMENHFSTLVEGIVADPNQRISELPLLTQTERNQLAASNDTQSDWQADKCIPDLFESQAQRTPNAVALACGRKTLSYAEVNRRANQLAHHLIRNGIGPESRVGICLPRSAELVVAILAVLKAGGAYVPLDPRYPADRLDFILNDSKATIFITQSDVSRLVSAAECRTVCLEKIADALAAENDGDPCRSLTPDNLAYVIYTSGSTGRPKGVAIAHRNTVAFIDWAHKNLSRDELSSVLFSTSVCFDLSIFEMFAPLTCGGRVIVVANALELIERNELDEISLINTVPSAIQELADAGAIPDCVKTVCLAGEPLSLGVVRDIYSKSRVTSVYNLYGPTEDTTYSTGVRIQRDVATTPVIGTPISNRSAYIVDRNFNLAPIGVPGQIYLGGTGLARGYLNRPDLTAERFVPNPFSAIAGDRMYKTGDLGRRLVDGSIQYLGRCDHQIKIRGHRVELGEIEIAAQSFPGVKAAAAVVSTENGRSTDIHLFVTQSSDKQCSADELRVHLGSRLPEYMLPAELAILDAMPLTPNGKIDRRALSARSKVPTRNEHVVELPKTATETALADLWATLLKQQQIGIHDNFFELGGHSLLAGKLIARIRTTFQVELPLRSIFDCPTIHKLAAAIDQEIGCASSDDVDALLSEIEKLSDADAEILLNSNAVVRHEVGDADEQ